MAIFGRDFNMKLFPISYRLRSESGSWFSVFQYTTLFGSTQNPSGSLRISVRDAEACCPANHPVSANSAGSSQSASLRLISEFQPGQPGLDISAIQLFHALQPETAWNVFLKKSCFGMWQTFQEKSRQQQFVFCLSQVLGFALKREWELWRCLSFLEIVGKPNWCKIELIPKETTGPCRVHFRILK